jgi:23S rRNA G2069 N7-methylase RlmK/C1962 C5-methylase RlmI
MRDHPVLYLKPGREKSLLRRPPWNFTGAVARLDGGPAPGAAADLLSVDGQLLARAAYSSRSQIRGRKTGLVLGQIRRVSNTIQMPI